jgi:hypothetical protein
MRLNADPSDVPDVAPTDSELRVVVGQLQNDHAAGTMVMKAKHLKEWLADMKHKKMEDGVEGIWEADSCLWPCCKWSGSVDLSQLR